MNKNTQCKIVYFGERAREAMISAIEYSKGDFGTTKVFASDEAEGVDEGETLSCFETTVGYARELRGHMIEAGKDYDFKIAVQRTRERATWRIAEDYEWIESKKRDKAKRRLVRENVSEKTHKRKPAVFRASRLAE